jgi:Family of unknown function (DUF6011)
MTTTERTALSPGIYQTTGRSYLVRDGAVRLVRRNGEPSRYVLARVHGAGLKVTGNGHGHEAALHALATGQATQVEVHCRAVGCGRLLTDEVSKTLGLGPEHRGEVA